MCVYIYIYYYIIIYSCDQWSPLLEVGTSFAELLPVRAEACRGRRGVVGAHVHGLPRLGGATKTMGI